MRFHRQGAEKCDDLSVAPSLQQRGMLIAYAAKKLDRVKLNLPRHDSLPPGDQRVGPDFELRVVTSSDHRRINVNTEFFHQSSLALQDERSTRSDRDDETATVDGG